MEMKKILLSLLFLVTCYAATIAQKVKIKTGKKVYYVNDDAKQPINFFELDSIHEINNSSKKKVQHGNFSFNYGLGSAVGVFGSDNLDKDGAGLALVGSAKSFRFSYIFQDRIGIGIGYKKHKNDVSVSAIENYFTTNIEVESNSPWIVNSILIGPSVNLVYTDEVALDMDLQCGLSFAKSPELSISRHYFDSSYGEPGKGEALSLSSNAKLLIFISNSFSFNMGIGYFTTKPRIANYNNDAKQPINVFELDFGLGVRIK